MAIAIPRNISHNTLQYYNYRYYYKYTNNDVRKY